MDIPEYDQLSREQLLQVKKDLTKIVNESSKCLLEVTRMLDNWTEGE